MSTRDPVSLRQIEDNVKVPNVLGDIPPLSPDNSAVARSHCATHSHADMVEVEAGAVEVRVPDALDVSDSVFEWGDVLQNGQSVEVPSFKMDVYPVTCASYDEFAVIRGGAWSSLPEMMSLAFRGRDLITDRHSSSASACRRASSPSAAKGSSIRSTGCRPAASSRYSARTSTPTSRTPSPARAPGSAPSSWRPGR